MPKLNRPEYVYDESASLYKLMCAFGNMNPQAEYYIPLAFGVSSTTFQRWQNGEWTEGLRTKYARAFQDATGIDLDRLMVIEAKQRLWKRDPSLRGVVTMEKFQTRQDVIDEIVRLKNHPAYNGTRFIAWQIPEISNEDNVNQWSRGSNKPEDANLEACLVALSRGLIETGTRNDLALRLSMRLVCGMEPEACLGLSTFAELVNAVFTRELRARGATIASQQTGINARTTKDLLSWTPDSPTQFPYGTIFGLVRARARSLWDAPSLERFERAAREFLDPKKRTPSVSRPAMPEMAHKEMVRKESVQTHEPSARAGQMTAEDGLKRFVLHLRGQLLQAAVEFPQEFGGLPIVSALEVGESVAKMRWCFTGVNVHDSGDWNPTEQEIEAIAQSIAYLRRTLLIVLGLPMSVRRGVMKRLAPELDELFLAFDASGVEDLVGFAEQIFLQRQQADLVRGSV